MRRELEERGPALERKLQEHPEMLTEEELEALMDFLDADIRRIKRERMLWGIMATLVVLIGGANIVILLVRALLR